MMTWKLTKSLSNPKDPEWDLLIKSSLGEGVHSDRIMGFLLSREALKDALKNMGKDLTPGQLSLEDYSTISGLPQFTISLSHTPECGAALVGERKNFRSLGIDIEREERLVKDSIIERVSHPEDLKLRNIELWCLKEAVFKTLMNTKTFPKPIEFSSIKISETDWSHSPSGLSGKWELEIIKPFVIARSFLES